MLLLKGTEKSFILNMQLATQLHPTTEHYLNIDTNKVMNYEAPSSITQLL